MEHLTYLLHHVTNFFCSFIVTQMQAVGVGDASLELSLFLRMPLTLGAKHL